MKKYPPSPAICLFAVLAALAGLISLRAEPVSADNASVSAGITPGGGQIVVEAHGVEPKVPVFFTAASENTALFGGSEVNGTITLKLHVIQGRAEVLTLGLGGDGDVTDVAGEGLKDWAVRQGTGDLVGKRFLDLRPVVEQGKAGPTDLELKIHTRSKMTEVPGSLSLLILEPGDAAGFSSKVTLVPSPSLDLRVTEAAGMVPFGEQASGGVLQFFSTGEGKIEVALAKRGAATPDAELSSAELTGNVDEAGGSVDFRLHAVGRAAKADARIPLLYGEAALTGTASGDGWHVELARVGAEPAYELVFERAGEFGIDLGFSAPDRRDGDSQFVSFRMPAGTVVPLTLDGLDSSVAFSPIGSVVPSQTPQGWRGFVPADGKVLLGWKKSRAAAEGALFFTGNEETDIRVGAGLLSQTSRITFHVLQGRMAGIKLRLEGPGEVLGVEGANVLGWKVLPAGKDRELDVQLSRPIEQQASLTLKTQSALGAFPAQVEAARWTPEGAVRHSGFIRIANSGAVRLETADVKGLMQLAPEQFPGGEVEGNPRQIFVYRFASANYSYRVAAAQILPEVNVSQVTTYELGETDRVINADLELDIREAALSEWTMAIPQDYAVVAVNGNEVADYVAESTATGGTRNLKILFSEPVSGRQLLHLQLEKNQPAGAGAWQIPPLAFPGAKSVRGHIGIVSAPGYRIGPTQTAKLAELPLSYFPKQTPGLQQAYRLRDIDWTAAMKIEALSQSVQADVFHLYSVKEGIVYGSVLLNYFVAGAPATEWRIKVPQSAGNIDVTGEGVRRDWRREGDQIVVSLHAPVLGAATLLVTFEQPMSARGGAIHPGEVMPVGVQGERGFVQVVSPLQVKFRVDKAEGGLLKLDPLELPAEFRLLTSAPSLAVYQYTARPFDLSMNVEWYAPGETVDQVVDFAKLSSQISRDGQVVTDAHIFVKTLGRKVLRMILPDGVRLWEARADNEVVNARTDGGQLLIPLPPRTNPNEPVDVALRLGQTAGSARHPVLVAPKMLVPSVINEWTLHSDPKRLLAPEGGTAELRTPNLTETGFEWLSTRDHGATFVLFLLIVGSALLLRGGAQWSTVTGTVIGGVAVAAALFLATNAVSQRRVNSNAISYATSVIPAGEAVSIKVANVSTVHAMLSGWGVLAAAAGTVLLGFAFIRRPAVLSRIAGMVLCSAGVLAQRGGAGIFFAAVAVVVFYVLVIRGLRYLTTGFDPRRRMAAASALLFAVASMGALFTAAAPARAQENAPAPVFDSRAKPAESMIQTWKVNKERLAGEIDLTVRGIVGESFLLLKQPAVLTGFAGDGLRVNKVENGGQTAYFVTPTRNGVLTAHAQFEMAAPTGKDIALPTGPAAVQQVSIQLDQAGWDITSPAAVRTVPLAGLTPTQSGATLALGPIGQAAIHFAAKRGDMTAEATQFYGEVANLYIPGPGVVNGTHYVTIRPVQGRVSQVEFTAPEGFTVGDVHDGPVGEWRFDPQTRKVRVAIEPAQTEVFKLAIDTQLGTEALPVKIALEPLEITGASGEVGTLAVAFGSDAQPEDVKATGLSLINLGDFDASLIPVNKDGQPAATLQQVYRYAGGSGGRLEMRVTPVAPEIRVTTKQVFSFGDDRLVVAADLDVAITRAGIFSLSFVLPEGLEVEALSGPSLSQWTEADEAGQRIITLHLTGQTMGEQTFALTLQGAAPHAQEGWAVPRLVVREATRQTGVLLLVPEKGIQLRDAGRENATQLDPRGAGGTVPGTLAFQLLQQDWNVKVAIEALEPWVTVQALQEVTMREGQTLTRLSMRYRVENAAVKQQRVRLPGLTEDEARTVRATGPAVSEFVKVAGSADEWDLRFLRGIAGETDAQIEFQGQTARDQGTERVRTPEFETARQTTLFVAIRSGGRLELDANDPPRGWQRFDWSSAPAFLEDRRDRSAPAYFFRVAEPEGPLAVNVHRHEVADALKLRVMSGDLTTIFSPRGPFLTAEELKVEVIEKSTLRVWLPPNARLFNTFVNGASVPVVREEDAYLFNVSPESEQDRTATIRLVYMMPETQEKGPIRLTGPSLGIPLENVSWHVVMPAGFEMKGYRSDLQLSEEEAGGSFGLSDYRSLVQSKQEADSRNATELLQKANSFLQQGDQQQAGVALGRAANSNALNEASNEDARVELRTLKTQQAVLGLNTRRQKLYLDNRADASRNEQLEQAANINPFMQGKSNYDPQQFDQLLQGNTMEENSALQSIAGRLVDQQLAAEPAPSAIDVTLRQNGRMLTFTRSLQVDVNAPLTLELRLRNAGHARAGVIWLTLLGVAIVAGMAFPRRADSAG